MNWYLTTLTRGDKIVERGWMLAETDRELIDYARAMRYGIDVTYVGLADMTAVTCEVARERERRQA